MLDRSVTALEAPAFAPSANLTITQNSSLDVTTSAVACRSSAEDEDGERIALGTTDNSFYRVFDLSQFALPLNAELTSVDAGITVQIYEEGTRPATGRLVIHTLPPGTNVENGFAVGALSELASADLSFDTDVRGLVNVGFDDPDNPFDGAPSLAGDELLVAEVFFADGSQDADEGTPRQYDAAAAGNLEAADGFSYLGTTDCGGITPTPFGSVGDGFDMEIVMVLNVDPGLSTVADARAAGAGEAVLIEGVVTRSRGAFVYIQDETGALVLRQTSGEIFDLVQSGALVPGAFVRVSGTLSEFDGLLQINGDDLASFEGLGDEDVPAPQVITLAELAANGEDYEGELVTISDVSFDSPDAQYQAETDYAITDASGTGTLRITNADDTELDGTDFVGNPVTVTGIVSQSDQEDPRDSGYQILPLVIGDISALAVSNESALEAVPSLGTVVPNPSAARASVSVTLQEAGHATVAVY
ncbi:DUF5689 domain-containing protein, partial [Rubrivirga sp.]|uniref:DUF5689 domain-containing protein n=1 Tax=Rubrivirga sp. TaxID=1885344 RepID=UPI003C76BF09